MSGVQPEAVMVTLRVAATLTKLGVPYLVGGSLASSFHGIPRSTIDVDLVADLSQHHIAALVADLEAEFYVDEERAREAVRRRSSFNLIHLTTFFKVDLFVLKSDPLARLEMSRRQVVEMGEGLLSMATPEDTVLQKLIWYRLGGGSSDRQWEDILGVVKVQWKHLDLTYLRRWAEDEGLTDLLEQALGEGPSAG